MIVWIYILFINIFTFFLYAEDKKRARLGQWRIPESTLLLTALLGGSVGALAAMRIYRHKTKKWKFKAGIPLMIVFHVILVIYVSFLTAVYI